jgi:hypothetical protein
MEAFCNLCKKEVCNKYFLKTHLEKMHGLRLIDYLADQKKSPSVRNPRTTPLNEVAYTENNHISSVYQNENLDGFDNEENSPFEDEYINDYVDEANGMAEEVDSSENQYIYHHQSISSYFDSGDDIETRNSRRAAEIEKETCDVCLKQFCNKYYVQKHKKDVHGIDMNENAPIVVASKSSKRKINELTDSVYAQPNVTQTG